MYLFSIICFFFLGIHAAVVPLATFDGKDGTTYEWNAINDPVMGGQSHSQYELDADNQRGHWWGAVEIVPALDAPGFCNLQAPPYGQKGSFKDVTGATSLVVTASQVNSTGLTAFNTMLMTSVTLTVHSVLEKELPMLGVRE